MQGGRMMQAPEYTIKSFNDLPAVFGVHTMSQILGLSLSISYHIVRTDGFPMVKVGKRILIPKEKFVNWFNQMADKNAYESRGEDL
jgi:hypothetical protein